MLTRRASGMEIALQVLESAVSLKCRLVGPRLQGCKIIHIFARSCYLTLHTILELHIHPGKELSPSFPRSFLMKNSQNPGFPSSYTDAESCSFNFARICDGK